ncbi:hypothetical protein Mapa_005232 [Marchantia paleacea]|nr:hypothetical protein Mapa_005232 [Marchantia paleacea]
MYRGANLMSQVEVGCLAIGRSLGFRNQRMELHDLHTRADTVGTDQQTNTDIFPFLGRKERQRKRRLITSKTEDMPELMDSFRVRRLATLMLELTVVLLLCTTKASGQLYGILTKDDVNMLYCQQPQDGIQARNCSLASKHNCFLSIDVLEKGSKVDIYCKVNGKAKVVNNDGFWQWVCLPDRSKCGYVSDFYLDCGGKICPVVDCP